MDYFPIFLDLRDRPVLLVGGGAVATRKAELLLQAGARVRVVAPTLTETLRAWRDAARVTHVAQKFDAAQLQDAALVIAATNGKSINAEVAAAARARNIAINVVDDAELSSFIVPAIVDRSPVIVAIGTGGRSPVLARWVRARIEALLPAQLGRLADLAGRWRERVRHAFANVSERRRFWERALTGRVASHALEGHDHLADLELRRELKRAAAAKDVNVGSVVLVGAGPGDPDLLTVRAARELELADVVLYDRLVSPAILARARRDAERIFVGKESGLHHVTQETTNDLLVRLAREGKRVVRLKGGDPFVFGRGGEELEVLAANGIAYSVVPGITAALGAAAASGIPLTHRDFAQSVTFVTGHGRDGGNQLDWAALAREQQTVVFYMGVANLGAIVAQLAAHGAPPNRPVAIVEKATHADQRVITGTLATIVERSYAEKVSAPALLIVGEVVALHDLLAHQGTGLPLQEAQRA
jgi:uroporphyrin-III C-methyltransferase/precorrin-2 dehydrogenase/sirohydrochlorin ferrochelatase